MILKEIKLLCFTYCPILRHLRNTDYPACKYPEHCMDTSNCIFFYVKIMAKQPVHYHGLPVLPHLWSWERTEIYLDKEWFIHREEVPSRGARDDLCPLLFYLSCWGIYSSITVIPEYIRPYSCSYNTQMGWTDYMGYPGSEVWRRSLHKLHILSMGRRCLLTIPT